MKATGIVRRIDDLGRVVIPKEIRTTLRIREGDPMEIFVGREGEVILKKYSPIKHLDTFAQDYADTLHDVTGHIAYIADRDTIIAVAGTLTGHLLNKRVCPVVEKAMDLQMSLVVSEPGKHKYCETCPAAKGAGGCKFLSQAIAPILDGRDVIGAVVLLSVFSSIKMDKAELMLVDAAAGFLARQME